MDGAFASRDATLKCTTEIIRIALEVFEYGVATSVARELGKVFPVAPALLDTVLELLYRFGAVSRRCGKQCTQCAFEIIAQQCAHDESLAMT